MNRNAVFVATLSLIINTNYSETIFFLGIMLSSTALSGILQAARWVWEPFVARKIGAKSDLLGDRIPILMITLLCAALGYALIPWQLPIIAWITIVLFFMLINTMIQTLMDSLASDVAKMTSVITVMTAYSVATDVGSALGPMVSYLFIELENGLISVYLGGAIIYLFIMLSFRIFKLQIQQK